MSQAPIKLIHGMLRALRRGQQPADGARRCLAIRSRLASNLVSGLFPDLNAICETGKTIFSLPGS